MNSAQIIPLGERLRRKQLLSSEQLKTALALQNREGGRIGTILVGEGYVSHQPLYETLAEQQDKEFVDLLLWPPDPGLLREGHLAEYIRLGLIPWRRRGERVVIAIADPSSDAWQWAQATYGTMYDFVMTSPYDIRFSIEKCFSETLDESSRNALWRARPHQSARVSMPMQYRTQYMLGLAVIAALFVWHPAGALAASVIIANMFYFATLFFKLELFTLGLWLDRKRKRAISLSAPHIPDRDLPVYTLLVPLYQEARSVPNLIAALRRLDYPKSRLDIKLIVEDDDNETIAAIKTARPDRYFEILRVPYSLPRTKPKACNYALAFARGEFVTIYDAEDRPEPQQLRKVVARFRAAPRRVACFQARLNYYNRRENILTQLFSIEYAAWFDFMLPALEALRIPIPLGGTSNHIALKTLKDVGGWDPYNVTEDADLGIRLALLGYRTEVVDSLTLEESPLALGPWLRQRSRWIKGYMQTWLVHMRRPVEFHKRAGMVGFWGFQFFVGGPCMVYVLSPFLWFISGLWALNWLGAEAGSLPPWLQWVVLVNLVGGLALHLVIALITIGKKRWYHLLPGAMVFPWYWILHSIASLKALWQLVFRPHYWEKTTHGLSRVRSPERISDFADF